MEQVLKYASLGYNQAEIAEVLHISQPWVSRTITAITKAAQEDVKRHIEETLPYERKKALTLFENVKKQALDIANGSSGEVGNRDKIAALALAKDATKEIWALNSQGEHVKSALNVAAGLQEKLDNLQKEDEEEYREELPLYDHEP